MIDNHECKKGKKRKHAELSEKNETLTVRRRKSSQTKTEGKRLKQMNKPGEKWNVSNEIELRT